jgi:hypothetical protein
MNRNNFFEELFRFAASAGWFRSAVRGALPETAAFWAGKNPVKKIIARLASSSVKKSLMREENSVPGGGNDEFFLFRKKLTAFIEGVDFGMMKESVDAGALNSSQFMKMINDELWKYPAKVVCVLSMVPSAANIAVSAVKESAAPMNRLAPDLLADVVLSLARDLDGKKAGTLINELAELIRKIHTGSALIGDPGRPALPETASALIKDTFETVDIPLLIKAGQMLEEMKAMVSESAAEVFNASPELSAEKINRSFRKFSSAARNFSTQVEAFEKNFSDDEGAEVIFSGMREIDPQELAGCINSLFCLLNRLNETAPGIFSSSINQFFSSLDIYEAGELFKNIFTGLTDAAAPAAGAVMPHLVSAAARMIADAREQNPEEMNETLRKLKLALEPGEAA